MCGFSYHACLHWGECEALRLLDFGFRTHIMMGNFESEVGLCPPGYPARSNLMQELLPSASLCFHLLVKKSAIQLTGDDARIQNAFIQDRHSICATMWRLLHSRVICGRYQTNCGRLAFSCLVWFYAIFDATLGFPGEGPRWSIISANVDSFATNVNCLQWDADAFMLQEARIAESNLVDAQRKAALCNFGLFCSQPLQKLRASNGTFRIPSGGTATCANKELTQLFDAKSDLSGAWSILCATTRVTATWHQVSPSVKVLAFNFYAVANAASERVKFERNNELLDQLLLVAAQFGDVPVLIAGDFQMEPGMYPAVQLALDHWGWADPLLQTNEFGEVFRPPTFFQQAAADGEGQSSIDGILMNRTALAALVRIEVLDHQDRQHRPVQASFAWDRIQQVGTILQRFAKLDVSEVPRCDASDPVCHYNQSSEQIWLDYESRFRAAANADCKWDIFNEFALDVLLQHGAKWDKGPRSRGSLPKFRKTCMISPQEMTGNPASPRLLLLRACLRSLRELTYRFGRTCTGEADARTFFFTQKKLLRRLKEAWIIPSSVHQVFAFDIPHLIDLTLQAIAQELKQMKHSAIRKWREAMKNATSSMTIGKVVYQYLKRKGRVVPQNLVEDDAGNIVYDPQSAMNIIAEKWDSVFSVNASHHHEMQILKQVWPYIHDKGMSVALGPITEFQLWEQAARRKPDAAAGLDGWQTREVQALPPVAFRPVAALFNGIEEGSDDFPTILTQVRMIILNKDGSDAPLSKRLISLQSIFTLLYTGLRFMQLQTWQQKVMPPQLKGSIKARQMAEVHMTLQLEIDHAHSFHGSFAALKLDKSKCFDRLMPKLCAAIMLTLGLPTAFVRAFLGLYTRMTRFLSFKQWTREQPISMPNGVVQGCSLSLLCINIHIAIWAWIICKIDGVDFRAFIDDTYLWTRQSCIDGLVAAVRATELWDSLCGQFLNTSKCEIFATTPELRKALKKAFPQMKLVEVVNILGAFVQTTHKNVGSFPVNKLQTALRDCEAIRALPCDSYKRAQILATKVLPQIAFAPQLNFVPKRWLARLQSAVADALWQDRPRWRSKHLLLCIIHKAHKLDPFLCRAVTTIVESVRFLQQSGSARRLWQQLFDQDQLTAQAWMTQFAQACSILDLDWTHTFEFSALGADPVNFLDFSVKDLKCVLKSFAANKCYQTAGLMPRKDVHTALGFLDLSLTLSARKKLAGVPNEGFSFLFHWESALVGCTLTADRLTAAGLHDRPNCRFCDAPKESMQHFVDECEQLPVDLRQPSSAFSLGPNFPMLGIVEIPFATIREKLVCSNTSHIQVYQWTEPPSTAAHVWTDGSVQLTTHPWLAVAAYAVVGPDQSELAVGRVMHWRLSSYSAELWGVLVAFAMASQPLVIHTDSLTIVQQFSSLLRDGKVQLEWTHANWWNFLFDLLVQRRGLHDSPLQLLWCPAHLLEHLPSTMITEEDAVRVGSSRQDIILNRLADNLAKKQIQQIANSIRADLALKEADVFARQLWLSKCNRVCKKPAVEKSAHVLPVQEPMPRYTARQMCPRWPWDVSPSLYTWHAQIDHAVPFCASNSLTETNFRTFLRFCSSIKWRIGDGFACSVFELAFLAFYEGWRFQQPTGSLCTPNAYATLIRAGLAYCKPKKIVVAPLLLEKGNKSNGKTFPKGVFIGAEAFVPTPALEMLARAFSKGAKQTPSSWSMTFDSLL